MFWHVLTTLNFTKQRPNDDAQWILLTNQDRVFSPDDALNFLENLGTNRFGSALVAGSLGITKRINKGPVKHSLKNVKFCAEAPNQTVYFSRPCCQWECGYGDSEPGTIESFKHPNTPMCHSICKTINVNQVKAGIRLTWRQSKTPHSLTVLLSLQCFLFFATGGCRSTQHGRGTELQFFDRGAIKAPSVWCWTRASMQVLRFQAKVSITSVQFAMSWLSWPVNVVVMLSARPLWFKESCLDWSQEAWLNRCAALLTCRDEKEVEFPLISCLAGHILRIFHAWPRCEGTCPQVDRKWLATYLKGEVLPAPPLLEMQLRSDKKEREQFDLWPSARIEYTTLVPWLHVKAVWIPTLQENTVLVCTCSILAVVSLESWPGFVDKQYRFSMFLPLVRSYFMPLPRSPWKGTYYGFIGAQSTVVRARDLCWIAQCCTPFPFLHVLPFLPTAVAVSAAAVLRTRDLLSDASFAFQTSPRVVKHEETSNPSDPAFPCRRFSEISVSWSQRFHCWCFGTLGWNAGFDFGLQNPSNAFHCVSMFAGFGWIWCVLFTVLESSLTDSLGLYFFCLFVAPSCFSPRVNDRKQLDAWHPESNEDSISRQRMQTDHTTMREHNQNKRVVWVNAT